MDVPLQLVTQLPQLMRSIRKSRRLSQAELAQLLGVTQARVAKIERNPSAISVKQFFNILQVLQIGLVFRDKQALAPSEPSTSEVPGAPYVPKGEW